MITKCIFSHRSARWLDFICPNRRKVRHFQHSLSARFILRSLGVFLHVKPLQAAPPSPVESRSAPGDRHSELRYRLPSINGCWRPNIPVCATSPPASAMGFRSTIRCTEPSTRWCRWFDLYFTLPVPLGLSFRLLKKRVTGLFFVGPNREVLPSLSYFGGEPLGSVNVSTIHRML